MDLDVEWEKFQPSAVLHGCYVMPRSAILIRCFLLCNVFCECSTLISLLLLWWTQSWDLSYYLLLLWLNLLLLLVRDMKNIDVMLLPQKWLLLSIFMLLVSSLFLNILAVFTYFLEYCWYYDIFQNIFGTRKLFFLLLLCLHILRTCR